MPRVSVGLPVYNGERHLSRALDSFVAQDYDDFELIISDNASTDGTREIYEEYAKRDDRIRYVRSAANVGAVRNFKRVFELATGEYFKWAAHDDWCAPQFLGRCVAVLEKDPSAALCFTGMGVADDEGRVFRFRRENLVGATSSEARRRFHSVLWSLEDPTSPVFGLIRSSALVRTGLIRNAPEPDRILIGELSLLGRIREIPEILFFHHGPPGHPRRDQWLWLDPSNTRRVRATTLRIANHHVAAVWRSDLGRLEKTVLLPDTLASIAVTRVRSKLRTLRKQRLSVKREGAA